MNITGSMLVGGSEVRGTEGVLRGWNPTASKVMEPDFGAGGQVEVDRACLLAQEAFDSYRETPLEKRAQFRAIGQGILDRRDKLVDRACAETGLPIKPQPIPRFTPTRRVFRMDGIVI